MSALLSNLRQFLAMHSWLHPNQAKAAESNESINRETESGNLDERDFAPSHSNDTNAINRTDIRSLHIWSGQFDSRSRIAAAALRR